MERETRYGRHQLLVWDRRTPDLNLAGWKLLGTYRTREDAVSVMASLSQMQGMEWHLIYGNEADALRETFRRNRALERELAQV